MKKKLFSAGIFYLLGNTFDKAIAFITVPIFTRLLSPYDYGVLSNYLSWTSILSVIITLSISESIRTAYTDFPEQKNRYISSMFMLGTISASIQTVFLFFLWQLLGNVIPLKLLLSCCAQAYAVSMLTMVQWNFVMEYKYLLRIFTQSIPNILIVFLSFFWIKKLPEDKFLGRIYPNVIVLILICLLFMMYFFIKGKVFYDKKYWKYALSFSIPLIFHSMSNLVLSQASRIMILFWWSSSEAGFYGLASQFGLIPLVIFTSLENIWIPWFSKMYSQHKVSVINKILIPYVWISLFLCIVLIGVFYEILILMVDSSYYEAAKSIPPIIASTYLMFLSNTLIGLKYHLKKTNDIAINTFIVAFFNIVLGYLFIPLLGFVAAAYTTMFSYLLLFALHYRKIRELDKEIFPLKVYLFPIYIILADVFIMNHFLEYLALRYIVVFFTLIVLTLFTIKYYNYYKKR